MSEDIVKRGSVLLRHLSATGRIQTPFGSDIVLGLIMEITRLRARVDELEAPMREWESARQAYRLVPPLTFGKDGFVRDEHTPVREAAFLRLGVAEAQLSERARSLLSSVDTPADAGEAPGPSTFAADPLPRASASLRGEPAPWSIEHQERAEGQTPAATETEGGQGKFDEQPRLKAALDDICGQPATESEPSHESLRLGLPVGDYSRADSRHDAAGDEVNRSQPAHSPAGVEGRIEMSFSLRGISAYLRGCGNIANADTLQAAAKMLAAPQVTDQMVERALSAYEERWRDTTLSAWTIRRHAMRAALTAALGKEGG